jgi:hypothetical protein
VSPCQPPDPAPASGETGVPRPDGDAIAVDLRTRAGLVTVVLTSAAQARARPARQAFRYRGRAYAGSVYLAAPSWRGSTGLGLTLVPSGGPAGRGVAETIAALVGADVAAWLDGHPEVLDLAAQAHAAAARARAQRDLELLETEITSVRRHLDELDSRQDRLRAIAVGVSPGLPAGTGQHACVVAGVPVDIEVAGGELAVTVGRYDPAAAGQLSTDPGSGTVTLALDIAGEDGGTGRPWYFSLFPGPDATGRPPGQEVQQ